MWKYFDEARKVAIANEDVRDYFLGAIGIRTDCTKLIKACNGPAMISTSSTRRNYPAAHAEYRLAQKLNKGSIVFVCRVKKGDNSYAMARPCANCQRRLASKGVVKVYYTINDNEYGVMYLDKNWKYVDV